MQLKRENYKLKREIEKLNKQHLSELEQIKIKQNDEIAEIHHEKEKEYALILDGKMLEHEDLMIDLENRIHQEYEDKITQYQEIIKTLKAENQMLYEENSLKQAKLDEQLQTISAFKQKGDHHNLTSRKMSSNTNKENMASNLDMSERLQGYWQKMKCKRSSRTRNNNFYPEKSISKSTGVNRVSVKRCNTSFNGSDTNSLMKSVDRVNNLKRLNNRK